MSKSQGAYRQFLIRVTLPVALVVVLLLGALLVTFLVVAWYQTEIALREEARLAEGALAVRGSHLQRTVTDYGAWDEAVKNLVLHPNVLWASDNIGQATFENLGLDMSFVVAPDDHTSFADVRGTVTTRPVDAFLAAGFERILERQRAGDLTEAVWGIATAENRPALVGVAPIRLAAAAGVGGTAPQHLLAFVEVIDDAMLDELGEIYLLPQLRMTNAVAGDSASVPLVAADGTKLGSLVWAAARPGDTLLAAAVPVWLGLALGFGLLTTLIFKQARSAARSIGDAEHRATHDALTDLPNRLLLFERLDTASRELASGEDAGFALLYLDLDDFKPVNDGHGHDAGDAVLKEVARRLGAAIGPADTAARLGGDEFALILAGQVDRHRVEEFSRTLIQAIEWPIAITPGLAVRIGATIGASLAPVDGADPLQLLRQADQALYLGKRSGKNQVRFHDAARAARRAG